MAQTGNQAASQGLNKHFFAAFITAVASIVLFTVNFSPSAPMWVNAGYLFGAFFGTLISGCLFIIGCKAAGLIEETSDGGS